MNPHNGYSIAAEGDKITCFKCGTTSENRQHVEFRYCRVCDLFHGPAPEALPKIPPGQLDRVCSSIMAADPDAEAILLVVFHPNKTAEPVFGARAESEFASPTRMAEAMHVVADLIKQAASADAPPHRPS